MTKASKSLVFVFLAEASLHFKLFGVVRVEKDDTKPMVIEMGVDFPRIHVPRRK
jgi:hypothetical protein